MTTSEILAQFEYTNVRKFRVVYPDSVKYIRFNGTEKSITNNSLLSPETVPAPILLELLKLNALEIHDEITTFWYVFKTPESLKPIVHPNPISEEAADQLTTLGGYSILSKTPA